MMETPSPVDPILRSGYSLGGVIARTLHSGFHENFPGGTHEYWMDRALQIAMKGVGWSAPNPSVGCCVVHGSQMIAEGFTQRFGQAHAERMALSQIEISDYLKDAVVYVTLEPCAHFGSQPPCVDLLIKAPMDTIVIGCQDPDSRVNGKGIEALKKAGKRVIVGVLENEVRAWHFPFLRSKKKNAPVWIGKWAQTVDGHLADIDGKSKWITNPKSRAYTHWLRQKYDAILIGANTWLADSPSLTVRDCATPHHRNPVRLIFDPKGKLLSLSPDAYFKEVNTPVKVFVCEENLKQDYAMSTSSRPFEVVPIRARVESEQLIPSFQKAVEGATYDLPLQSIFVEGGPFLLNSLLRHNGIDCIHQFIAPFSFEQSSDRHRILWKPDSNWSCQAHHNFDGDLLREWVNCF